MTWVVVGTDNFSYEDYPAAVRESRDEALAIAAERAKAPNGTLPDTFMVYPMAEAMRRCNLSAHDIVTLAAVLEKC